MLKATRIGPFSFTSRETPVCPHCGAELVYRDTCSRHYRLGGGRKVWFSIRRLKCPHCRSLHRELPDILAPFKHYHIDIIMGMLDGRISTEDLPYEDYPCEKTVERWKAWLKQNRTDIDGYMKSVGYRLLEYGEELLYSTVSLLDTMMSSMDSWLAVLLRTIYNSGGWLQPLRPQRG